jgi:hypothetical protein
MEIVIKISDVLDTIHRPVIIKKLYRDRILSPSSGKKAYSGPIDPASPHLRPPSLG